MSTDPIEVLRAADPARTLLPLSPAELLARRTAITARVRGAVDPASERSARPRRTGRTLALAAVTAIAVAGVAVAAGVRPWQRDEARQVGPEKAGAVFQHEYRAAQRALRLPPGVSWPERSAPPDSVIPTGRGGLGESTAVVVALGAWECYVVGAHDRGDAAAVAGGIAALGELVANHIVDVPPGTPEDGAAPSSLPGPIAQFVPNDEPTAVLFGRWSREAAAGDVSHLREACTANG